MGSRAEEIAQTDAVYDDMRDDADVFCGWRSSSSVHSSASSDLPEDDEIASVLDNVIPAPSRAATRSKCVRREEMRKYIRECGFIYDRHGDNDFTTNGSS